MAEPVTVDALQRALNDLRHEMGGIRMYLSELCGLVGVDAYQPGTQAVMRDLVAKVGDLKERHRYLAVQNVKLDQALEQGGGRIEWSVPGAQIVELKTEYLYPSKERRQFAGDRTYEAFIAYVDRVAGVELVGMLMELQGAVTRKDDGEAITHVVRVWRP